MIQVDPDPVAFTRDLLISLIPATAIADVPVVADRLDGQLPPALLVQDGGHSKAPGVGAYSPARIRLSAWALTQEEASAIYRAASRLLHLHGPASNARGRCWQLLEEVGSQPIEDPDTHWQKAFGVFDVVMADR